jgi:long-chain acyl-CoA synthetase
MRTIADIVPARAEATPDRTALVELAPDGGLAGTSFADLARQVEAFAARLHEEGAAPGGAVALLMRNSRRWVAAYHAVFRLAAVAVPLEHGLLATEADRLRHALDDAYAAVVVCDAPDADQVRRLAGPGRSVLVADEVQSDADPAASLPTVRPRPGDLAQLLYTSGTTGARKGVELTHGNIIFDVAACCRRFGVRPGDRLPALLPYHHAYPLTTTVVLPPWAGACMAVGDITERRSRDLLRMSRPTVLVGVPRVFESLLDGIRRSVARSGRLAAFQRALRLSGLVKRITGVNVGRLIFRRLHGELFGGTQLRFCVSGGARISPAVLTECFLLGIPLVQGWGMSELSPVAAAQPFSPALFRFTRHYERKAGSIGPPLEGTAIELVQSLRESLSFDLAERGEMVVRGPHVMRGYHGDPERTARQTTERGLRSGDVARRDRDGDLYIVGRVKHVIVLPSGKKVFPEDDLDEPLSHCETIEEFAVRPVADEDGAEKIGIVVRPCVEALRERGVRTVGELCEAVRADVQAALRDSPSYVKHYELCLTPWVGDGYAELVKTALGNPCPLKNPFLPDRSYARLKDSPDPVPWSD